jgi:hypothetical protein
MSDEASVNIGALQQRVYGLEQAIGGISQQIGALATKIDQRAQTNWPVLIGFGGFALSVMVAIGGMAYWPIREAQSDFKSVIAETNKSVASLANQTAFQINQVGERFVSIRELEGRSSRARAEMDRMNTDITSQETNLRRFIEQADANLQRQIDDQKKAFGDTFSLRDAIQQMRRDLDEVRRRPS